MQIISTSIVRYYRAYYSSLALWLVLVSWCYGQSGSTVYHIERNGRVSISNDYRPPTTNASQRAVSTTSSLQAEPAPSVQITTDLNSMSAVCAGSAFSFTATAVNFNQNLSVASINASGGVANISPQFLGSKTISATILSSKISPPGTYTLTVTLSGTSQSATALVVFILSPIPQPPAVSSFTYCQGQLATPLNATATADNSLKYYSGPTGDTQLSIPYYPSTLSPGLIRYYVSQVSAAGCESARAAIEVTTKQTPVAPLVSSLLIYCQGQRAAPLNAVAPTDNSLRFYDSPTSVSPLPTPVIPSTLQPGSVRYYVSQVSSEGCESSRAIITVQVNPLPTAPSLLTASGYPYPAGVSSLTISQNVGPVSLTVVGCSGGMLMANGSAVSSFTVSTAMTGTQTYTATCTSNGCTSTAGSFQLTVVPTTLSVLHRDADYGNTGNNIIKPYLELANAGSQVIPYGEVTVRYWLTSEGQAPPTNLAVYYAQLGAVSMTYVPLSQPRQGAFGYVEYSFPGGGSLSGGGNSGSIENGIQKTDGSNFNESDDYSYQANYADYVPNMHITAYRNGTIIYGQEPTAVSSQTAVQVYSAAKDGPTTSQIQTRLELRNTGNVALSVSSLKIRYYFTSDNGQTANVYVDYADIGAQNVQAQVVKLGSPVNGADSYVELTFPGNTIQVNALSSLGVIDFRIVRSDNGLFNQSNDYSYVPNYGNVGLNNYVTAYLNNTLIFGTPPSGPAARVAASEPISALSVRVLGNPVTGSQVQVEISGAEGQAVSLRLVDFQGRLVHEQRIEQAGTVEPVSVPIGQSRGTLLLKVNTANQQQSLKLLRP